MLLSDKEFNKIVDKLVFLGFYRSDAITATAVVIDELPLSYINPDATPVGGGIEV